MPREVLDSSSSTLAAHVYIAAAGSDSTGAGTRGAPYRTLAHALATLAAYRTRACTIHVADGTYDEAIDIRQIRDTQFTILGNRTTPANVTFTGSVAVTSSLGKSGTAVAAVVGDAHVAFEGLTLRGDGRTQDTGLYVADRAAVVFDCCSVETSSGPIAQAIACYGGASIEFKGDVSLSGIGNFGITAQHSARLAYTSSGTLAITGSGTQWGLHLFADSEFITYTAGTNITISNCLIGIQMGLHARFQHQGAESTITICGPPGNTGTGIQGTDLSTFSTSQALVLTNLSKGVDLNSISYAEANKPTYTNVRRQTKTAQNSVTYQF